MRWPRAASRWRWRGGSLDDRAAVLRRHAAQLDWQVLVGTAERWGVQSFVRFTLLLTRALLGAPLPDAIHAMRADADEAMLLENARAYVLNITVSTPVAFTSAVRTRGWKRLQVAAGQIFPPPARLAALYGVRQSSPRVLLLYLLRPFDMLLRRGRLTLELLLPGRSRRRMRYREQNRVRLKTSLSNWAQIARTPAKRS